MNDSSVIIRIASVEDAAGLIEFFRGIREERCPGVFEPVRALPTVDEEVTWIQSLLDDDRSNIWVGVVGGRIVGILDFHGHSHPQIAHGGALGTSVLRSARGRGVGYGLMRALIDWATAHQSLHRIELEVFSNNINAIAFYERQGFVREGARKGAVLVGGMPHDILLMALRV